jgi:glycosyltransferase involved in cell wall biosynthesis
MKIAILGTRGVPNHYGGFEQFAQYLSKGLTDKGHQVWVYNPHNHPFQSNTWEGVRIIHKYDPEDQIGTAGQFIYDFNCILDSHSRSFDVILQLGYTSSSVWHWMMPRKPVIMTNMDGLEWKRTKYSRRIQSFLKFAESLSVSSSDHLIADSLGIQSYIREKYDRFSTYIPYGATVFDNPDVKLLDQYKLQPFKYTMLIARLEPENNIETILTGICKSETSLPCLVIGNHNTTYGKYLKAKFNQENIRFMGSVYDIFTLNNLRHYCYLYFHGHTVGGTNPSLLEAMASEALICAHNNEFNSHILGQDAFYFQGDTSLAELLNQSLASEERETKTKNNVNKIKNQYTWDSIVTQYEVLMQRCVTEKSAQKAYD